MYRNTVPTNKLQKRFHSVHNEALSPGTGTRHTSVGILLEVYDQEKLLLTTVSEAIKREVTKYPGLLFAKVQLSGGLNYVLPFKEPEDYIYLVFGNSLLLEGRPCKVEYEGMAIENGQIIIQRSFADLQISIPATTSTLDIGGIV